MDEMITTKQLCFGYGEHLVLQQVTLQLRASRVTALFGPNGSGKSTLLRCLNGMLQPQSGCVLLGGIPIQQQSARQIAKQIAYVPAHEELVFPFSVQEMVFMGRTPHLHGLYRPTQEDKRVVQQILQQMDLLPLADHPYPQLSSGQQQLTLLARALAQQTDILLLDEPTSALDYKNQLLVWKRLSTLAQKGKTVLICTHDPNALLWFADEVIAMKNGTVLAQGKVKEVFDQTLLDQLYDGSCRLQENAVYPQR